MVIVWHSEPRCIFRVSFVCGKALETRTQGERAARFRKVVSRARLPAVAGRGTVTYIGNFIRDQAHGAVGQTQLEGRAAQIERLARRDQDESDA